MEIQASTAAGGRKVQSFTIGTTSDMHHLRAVLTLAFVAQAWQVLDEHDADADQILKWVDDLALFGINVDVEEVTEEDLQRVLTAGQLLKIDYACVPSSWTEIDGLGLPFGSEIADATIGLWKIVHGEDGPGPLSRGDVVDVVSLLDFISAPVVELTQRDAQRLSWMRFFFQEAARNDVGVCLPGRVF